MRSQSTMILVAIAALAGTVGVAGQADRAARLRNPAALTDVAPATFKASVVTGLPHENWALTDAQVRAALPPTR